MQNRRNNVKKPRNVVFDQRTAFELRTTWIYAKKINSNTAGQMHFTLAMVTKLQEYHRYHLSRLQQIFRQSLSRKIIS